MYQSTLPSSSSSVIFISYHYHHHVDKNIRLIDSPGIVFADGNTTATALRNCVNVEEMIDVYTPIQGYDDDDDDDDDDGYDDDD